ncbi:phosphoribosylanthranilate isomerase [Marinobacterium arenosum]|uniref:phosphoribosylanthranilate isomerase n=1 Tax=Marinobacterium arenosum TaxID=2862496 RepID=UPI001C979D9A|nr:phosphoribosylanthranilate isomerase [Marinobacterium arenosum]MBY4675145.1 phosphoribosylanthranilate isomerase [Marinobacterium arenosum]
MTRTRVKICGITRLDDAQAAIAAGADALGFVFYKPSPRYIAPDAAAQIIERLPPFVTTVGLFVNETAEQVARTLQLTGLDLLQFHGDESEAFCAGFERPYFKALRMKPELDVLALCQQYDSARAILLDAYRPGVPGGTGEAFDWARIPAEMPKSLILAGGLTPDNVRTAIEQVRPYAVDVSGGVEAAKGIKDQQKIEVFMQEVARANQY